MKKTTLILTCGVMILAVMLGETVEAFSVPQVTSIHHEKAFSRAKNYRTALAAGPAIAEPPVKEEVEKKETIDDDQKEKQQGDYKKGGYAVRLFNDPVNKREFVALCLCQIVGLSDGQAYQVMMQAHQNGLSVVGRFDQERAELYRDKLVENGLVCDMVPVEDD